MDLAARTAANRRLLADFFDGLNESQLETQSLCSAWTVREVLGHSAMPFSVGIGRLLWRTLLARGSIDRASAAIAVEQARRPVTELTGTPADGPGAEVAGPSEALAMALSGRSVALADLDGPGLATLRERIG